MSQQRGGERHGILFTLLESVSDAVAVVDELGDTLFTNDAYDRLMLDARGHGFQLEHAGSVVGPEAMPLLRAARREAVELEVTLLNQPRAKSLYRVTIRPVPPRDPSGAAGVVTFRNVSTRGERREHGLEARLVELLGHELRAPVSALQSFAELLVHYLDGDLASAEAQTAVRRIHNLSVRLGLMVQDLYEMARISSDAWEIAQVEIDPREVVMSAVDVARTLPNMPTIATEATAERVTVRGDARRLSGAVLNLLTNAAKHAHTSERVDVRIRSNDQSLMIDVEDYGPGIPADDLPRIFHKYVQSRHRFRNGSRRQRSTQRRPRPRSLPRPADRPGAPRPHRGHV